MSSESLTLKWGSLKHWDLSEDGPAFELLKKWHALGVSMSAMMHRDTPEQKQILCDLIDAADVENIYLDWDGEEVTKEDAKKYVMEYGNGQAKTGA